MAPPHTPPRGNNTVPQDYQRHEHSSLKKAKFYDAYDGRFRDSKTVEQICTEQVLKRRTAGEWLQKRKELGRAAERRTRKQYGNKLRRPEKVGRAQCQFLVSKDNEIRDHALEEQMAHYKFQCSRRTFQTALRKYTRNAQMYRKARVKAISDKNKKDRVQYGWDHGDETIDSYWQFVWFSDEGHIDASTTPGQRILREEGTRLEPENLQEMPGLEGVSVHVSGSCNWHRKGPLVFYNCSDDPPDVKIQKEPKPRRRPKTETPEQYDIRVRDWEARQPHEPTVKPAGNSMTQQYYRDVLLPGLVAQVKNFEREFGRGILQEDNDSSHGTRPNKAKKTPNVCEQYRIDHNVETMKHPAQSPDLNCQEGVWNIFTARVRREPRRLGTKRELMDICLRVWDGITQEEIQERIKEMPWRCKLLRENGGMAIKSYLW